MRLAYSLNKPAVIPSGARAKRTRSRGIAIVPTRALYRAGARFLDSAATRLRSE